MKPYYDDGKGIVIYHGDCLEILPTLPKVDLILTDPPYGIDYGRSGGFNASHGWGPWRENVSWDQNRPTAAIFTTMLLQCTNAIIWGGNYFADFLPPKMGWIVWNKGQRDFSLADGELAWTTFDKALRIADISRAEARLDVKQHPTQKPLRLMTYCFNYALRNVMGGGISTVCDPYAGSGTTLRAAKDLGLKATGIEMEEKYCEIIASRLEQSVFNFDEKS